MNLPCGLPRPAKLRARRPVQQPSKPMKLIVAFSTRRIWARRYAPTRILS